jgi:hypothetical protein
MTLHAILVAEMLAEEVQAAKVRLRERVSGVFADDTDIFCHLEDTNRGDCTIRLVGRSFDAEPFEVGVVDTNLSPLGADSWPGNLCAGVHPVLQRPFACVRGTYEYHTHPSHLNDPWDAIRFTWRLPQLLDHLVKKSGR